MFGGSAPLRCIDIERFLKWLAPDSLGATIQSAWIAGRSDGHLLSGGFLWLRLGEESPFPEATLSGAPHVNHQQTAAEPRFAGTIEAVKPCEARVLCQDFKERYRADASVQERDTC